MFNRETTVRYVIHSEGYPLSTYLVIEATEADITRVDLYADGNLQMMIAEDIDFDRLPEETRQNIHHALHARACAQRDGEDWNRRVSRFQTWLAS